MIVVAEGNRTLLYFLNLGTHLRWRFSWLSLKKFCPFLTCVKTLTLLKQPLWLTLWKLTGPGHCSANCWLLSPATVRVRGSVCAQGTSRGLDVGFFKSLELIDCLGSPDRWWAHVYSGCACNKDRWIMGGSWILSSRWEKTGSYKWFLRPSFRVELVLVIQCMAWLSWKAWF